MSLEAEVFEQAKKRARRRGFFLAIALVLIFVFIMLTLNSFIEYEKNGSHIARIKVDGPIIDDIELNRLIYDLSLNQNVKALIVHINSPGGSVVGA